MKLQQIEQYLYDDSPELLEQLAKEARRVTRQRFGRVIQMYAPVYISNECVDTCTYCGFSRPNEIVRRTMTPDQVAKEVDFLRSEGFRHLLLVAGEHPQAVSVDYLCAVAKKLRPSLASLSIEVAPFEVDDYRRLTAAGVDGVVIYQETYDRTRYGEVHVAGPKRDYDKRMDAPERAAQGGARRIGMGILLGLSDWRHDALRLIEHVRAMQKRYWQVEFQVSLPRLKPCASELVSPVHLRDAEFVRLMCLLRLALPEVGLVLSTRESESLRNGLIPLGVTQMSAGSRTEPGGYLEPEQAGEQFSIEDHRSPKEVAAAISRQQLEPVWKDWDASLH